MVIWEGRFIGSIVEDGSEDDITCCVASIGASVEEETPTNESADVGKSKWPEVVVELVSKLLSNNGADEETGELSLGLEVVASLGVKSAVVVISDGLEDVVVSGRRSLTGSDDEKDG